MQMEKYCLLERIVFLKTHIIVDPVGGAQISNSVLRQQMLSFETRPLGGAAGETNYTCFGHVWALYIFSVFMKTSPLLHYFQRLLTIHH